MKKINGMLQLVCMKRKKASRSKEDEATLTCKSKHSRIERRKCNKKVSLSLKKIFSVSVILLTKKSFLSNSLSFTFVTAHPNKETARFAFQRCFFLCLLLFLRHFAISKRRIVAKAHIAKYEMYQVDALTAKALKYTHQA